MAISEAVSGPPEDAAEQSACIEALLLTAATMANAMSDQSTNYSSPHVTESAEQMRAILEETFAVDI